MRRLQVRFWKTLRVLTAARRTLPDYLVIGVQKGGTTSLHHYLEENRRVIPAFKKEVKFFDCNFGNGLSWYRSHFPFKNQMVTADGKRALTGEASPYYIYHPAAPSRTAQTLPSAKLILLLRDPVERAYSHYQHNVRTGREDLSFEAALEMEPERLDGEVERILADPNYPLFKHMHYSYLDKGIYLPQIQRWLAVFPKENLLILKSEDFYRDPAGVLEEVTTFLGLPPMERSNWKPYNQGEYSGMDDRTRRRLNDYFRPHNAALSDFLGRDFTWQHAPA